MRLSAGVGSLMAGVSGISGAVVLLGYPVCGILGSAGMQAMFGRSAMGRTRTPALRSCCHAGGMVYLLVSAGKLSALVLGAGYMSPVGPQGESPSSSMPQCPYVLGRRPSQALCLHTPGRRALVLALLDHAARPPQPLSLTTLLEPLTPQNGRESLYFRHEYYIAQFSDHVTMCHQACWRWRGGGAAAMVINSVGSAWLWFAGGGGA